MENTQEHVRKFLVVKDDEGIPFFEGGQYFVMTASLAMANLHLYDGCKIITSHDSREKAKAISTALNLL